MYINRALLLAVGVFWFSPRRWASGYSIRASSGTGPTSCGCWIVVALTGTSGRDTRMSFSLAQLLLFIVAYLSGLFAGLPGGIIPERISKHRPPTYRSLSLGSCRGHGHQWRHGPVTATGTTSCSITAAWCLCSYSRRCCCYRCCGCAGIPVGLAGRCPHLSLPSPWVGAAITVAMCLTCCHCLPWQIQAVADSIRSWPGTPITFLQGEPAERPGPCCFASLSRYFPFCSALATCLRRSAIQGLVTAIAFESLVKLAAMFILLFAAVYGVFGSFGEVERWLADNPQVSNAMEHSCETIPRAHCWWSFCRRRLHAPYIPHGVRGEYG